MITLSSGKFCCFLLRGNREFKGKGGTAARENGLSVGQYEFMVFV
jgi:hypothetical protein